MRLLRGRDLRALAKRLPKCFCQVQPLFSLNSFRYSSNKNCASSSEISPFVRAAAIDFPQIRISNSFLFTVASKFEIRSIYHVCAIKQTPPGQPVKGIFVICHLSKSSPSSAVVHGSWQTDTQGVTTNTAAEGKRSFHNHQPQHL